MRLISANALIELANSRKDGMVDANDIARFPAIEAEPVRHGEWKKKKHKIFGNTYDYVCSSCGCDYALAEYAYCPNCGAKMDGKVNKE